MDLDSPQTHSALLPQQVSGLDAIAVVLGGFGKVVVVD